MLRFLLLLSFLAQPAIAADQPVSPAEFEALVTGKTLSYSSRGKEYGIEEYSQNRRVRWSFLNGDCVYGRWYEADEQVCFVYEGIDMPQCWSFFLRNDKLVARFENDPPGMTEIHETKRHTAPMQCMPEAGA